MINTLRKKAMAKIKILITLSLPKIGETTLDMYYLFNRLSLLNASD